MRILEGQYSFAQVASGHFDSLFKENTIAPGKGTNDIYYWAKIKITSDTGKITSWILETEKLYSDVNCYIVYPDGKVVIQNSGWAVAPAKRSVPGPDVIFSLSLAAQQSVVVYLQVHTSLRWSEVNNIKCAIVPADTWYTRERKVHDFFMFYGGICLLAIFYWLITFIYSVNKNYLILMLATLCHVLYYLDNFGVMASLFWGDYPWYFLSRYPNFFLFPFFIFGTASTATMVADLRTHRSLHKLYWGVVLSTGLFPVVSSFFLPWKTANMLSLLLPELIIFVMTGILMYLWLKKNDRSAAFAMISYVWLDYGYCIFALVTVELLPASLRMVGPVGALVSILVLFYGMVDYVRVLRKKRQKQQKDNERLVVEQNLLLEQKVEERTQELNIEKRKTDKLLHQTEDLLKKSDMLLLNILPAEVAEELKEKGHTAARSYAMVTVMFVDFKSFTLISEQVSAELLVAEIDRYFSEFDNIIEKYNVEKIKTIGDSYMCVSGLPVITYTHAADMVNAAFEIQDYIARRKKEKEAVGEIAFEARVGIHSGSVVAGIVGIKKFAYDIWGDTVNQAARMESSGEVGKINISGSTYQMVKNKFNCIHRGKVKAKNKGELDMYFVERLTHGVE